MDKYGNPEQAGNLDWGDTSYEEALTYLSNLTKFGINLGLDRIKELLSRVDNPERKLRVVHVGGTNGKGSTSIMIAEILERAGYKVGLFTSPHLHDYRERITINGEMIPKNEVVHLVDCLKPHLESLVQSGVEHPTEFEVSTAMAFMYFARERVDFAVIEVGLGGEIDSTNVVNPLIAVITNVGMDHMDYLGQDLRSIAAVKAGIIKTGTQLITASDRPEVLEVIESRAEDLKVPVWKVGEQVRWEKRWAGELEQKFDLFGLYSIYEKLTLRLIGDHQLKNAATAVTACEVLTREYGIEIPREAIYRALKEVQWPGRLELISLRPKVLLDGAHNVDGAIVLAKALPLYQRKRLILCLGMLSDKEREKVVELLVPFADEVIITRANSPRAGNWTYLAEIVRRYNQPVYTIENPRDAVNFGLNLLESDDMLCITGSLYMIAEAREEILRLKKLR
ncbi:MAG: bifunctional folylpolyglutamate synthase/dihydrofolate synthase [Desulfitobacterium hafniense]|nr:bifunctional folylpolyglutamate synthase/dihydrofolate synthase [Desulfitobacterium hafniense]